MMKVSLRLAVLKERGEEKSLMGGRGRGEEIKEEMAFLVAVVYLIK